MHLRDLPFEEEFEPPPLRPGVFWRIWLPVVLWIIVLAVLIVLGVCYEKTILVKG